MSRNQIIDELHQLKRHADTAHSLILLNHSAALTDAQKVCRALRQLALRIENGVIELHAAETKPLPTAFTGRRS